MQTTLIAFTAQKVTYVALNLQKEDQLANVTFYTMPALTMKSYETTQKRNLVIHFKQPYALSLTFFCLALHIKSYSRKKCSCIFS